MTNDNDSYYKNKHKNIPKPQHYNTSKLQVDWNKNALLRGKETYALGHHPKYSHWLSGTSQRNPTILGP